MPAYVYSQIKDPETGLEVSVPQLFPYASSTGMISHGEIEGWVKTGAIPTHMYETHLHDLQKMQEISERRKNGEAILLSELPQSPWDLTEFMIKNKASLYGDNILLKIFSTINENDQDIVWLSFIKEAITCISSQNPLSIHFLVATKTLKDKFSIDDPKARDPLARELVENCHKILKFQIFQHKAFSKNPIDIEDLNDHLKDDKRQILKLDAEFITHLKSVGKSGKKIAEDIEQYSLEIYQYYEDQNYPSQERSKVWGLWLPHNNEPTNLALEYLAEALWEDRCSGMWHRRTTGTPALVKPIIDKMIPLLSPKEQKKFIEKDGSIICIHEDRPIFTAPAVDVNAISAFQKGVNELGTLTGHKMLRWLVNSGFERWENGEKDPRLIKIDGGYSTIAELSGCRSSHEIAKVKAILYAQAFGSFRFQDGSYGNMLAINIMEKHRNQEPSKINIVLGEMLLPSYVCQMQRSERRLIPIGDLPPLHGSGNSHAAQAQLQLLIFSEFSDQSIRLAQQGAIIITNERWKHLALQAGLDPEKIDLVINHWCERDLLNCFLEKQGDEFRLAHHYERAHKFLEDQGENRMHNSKRGKKSAVSKKNLKKKVEIT